MLISRNPNLQMLSLSIITAYSQQSTCLWIDLLVKLNTNASLSLESLVSQEFQDNFQEIDVQPPNAYPFSLKKKRTVGPQSSHNSLNIDLVNPSRDPRNNKFICLFEQFDIWS
eukprot:403344736